MSNLQRMRSQYEDNNAGMTGTDDESYSDNEGRKSADLKPTQNKKKIDSEDYKKRRARNNEAVRKSRERAKKNYEITEARVKKLREENLELSQQKDGKTKELNVLQDLARSLNLPQDE